MKRNTMPSLAALLGLLAVAGYQNRDKLGELLNGLKKPDAAGGTAALPGPLGGIVKSVTDAFGGNPTEAVNVGVKDLVDRFRNAGQGGAADSWVAKGPNEPVTTGQTETALGGDLIDMLEKQTGLSRQELLARLSKILPEAVDKLTPEGRIPAPSA